MTHKGVHTRGYLHHWDFADSVQAITFRLADSLPNQRVKEWKEELRESLKSLDSEISSRAQAELHRRISHYEDAGHGECLLKNSDHADFLQKLLIHGHDARYKLIDWCIMPNHVHVLIHLLDETSLGKIVKDWKGASAVAMNRLEGVSGPVWMADYHDRLVRDMNHLQDVVAYIRKNPVKAGLSERPEDWEFSSAGQNWSAEFIPRGSSACSDGTVLEGVEHGETAASASGVVGEAATDSRGINSALPVGESTLPVGGGSLRGHLDLRCDLRADGVPYISRQAFRAPVHLSKSHLDQGALVQSIVNPTAGFFDGDCLEMNVEVGHGARLVLSTPSASRVYRTRSGAAAENHQTFRVEEGAFLEWIPEPFIPHAGARYFQRTNIGLAASASLLYFDWIAPGRVAMGETFQYENLRWELDLTVDGALLARERYDLQPGGESLEALKAKFPAAHYLSVYAAGIMGRNWPAEKLDALTGDDVYLGHGPMPRGVHVIRALCRDSLAARQLIETLRRELHEAAGVRPAALGRISW